MKDSEESRECDICCQSGVDLSLCTFCGIYLCYDCIADHEFECEDKE